MTFTLEEAPASALITGEHLAELTDLLAFLYAELHLGPEVELAVSLVDESEMERLHLEWMDLPGATDVLSFPMDELSPGTAEALTAEGALGDLVLCPAVAAVQAEVAGHSLTEELCLLTTHGFLHLLGYDHHDDADRTEMFGLQSRLLSSYLGRPAPAPTETGT